MNNDPLSTTATNLGPRGCRCTQIWLYDFLDTIEMKCNNFNCIHKFRTSWLQVDYNLITIWFEKFLPEQKCPSTHCCSLTDKVDDETGHGHHCTLGHTPGRLNYDEVLVSNVRWAVGSHIWRHVCHHVAEGVERAHGELEEEPPEDSQQAVEGDVPEDEVVDGCDFRHL